MVDGFGGSNVKAAVRAHGILEKLVSKEIRKESKAP